MGRLLCTLVIGTTVFLSGFVRTSTGAPIDVAIPGNLTVWSAIISSLPAPTTTPRIPKPAIPLPCTNGNGCPNGDQCQDGLCEETKICGGFIGIECPDGYFCLTPPGTADFFGTCIKVPTFLLPCNPPCPEPRYCIDPGCGMQFCAPPIPQLLLAVDSRTQNDTPTPTDTSITPSNSLTPTIPTSSTNSNIVTSSVPAPTTTSEGPRPTEPITCKDGSSCPKGYQCQEGLCEHPKKCGGFVGIECPDGYFCLTPPGTADEFGTCIKIPQFPSPCNPSCPEPRYCIDPSCEIQICVPPTLQLPDIKKSNTRLARRQDPGVIFWTDFTPVETEPPMITEVIPWTTVTTPTPNTFPFTSTTPFAIETNSTMSVAVLPTTTTDTPFPSMTVSPSLV